MAASGKTRVYVTEESESPPNAILRRDEKGSLYYVANDDGVYRTVGGPQENFLLEVQDLEKEFASYEDMDDCISENQSKDDPGAYCASIHHEATGEWPAEKYEKMTDKVYVASEKEAPDGVELKEDSNGQLYYKKEQAYHHASALYSDDVEDKIEEETDVDMPDADSAGEGNTSESDFDDELEDLRDAIHGIEDEPGPESVA